MELKLLLFFTTFFIGSYEVLALQHTWYWKIVHTNTDNSQKYSALTKHWKINNNIEGDKNNKHRPSRNIIHYTT